MNSNKNDELVKRIAKLAKQTQELEEYIKELEKQNDKLTRDNEKHKALIENLRTGVTKEEKEPERREERSV